MKMFVKYKAIKCVLLDSWMVRIEKKAFGWEYAGDKTEVEEYQKPYRNEKTYDHGSYIETVVETGTTTERNINKYRFFARVSPYSFNPLFHLFEKCSQLFAFVRRILMVPAGLLLGFLIFWGGIGLLIGDSDMTGSLQELMPMLIGVYGFLVVLPSMLFALGGFLLRKLFSIDQKVEEMLTQNGYQADWRAPFKNN